MNEKKTISVGINYRLFSSIFWTVNPYATHTSSISFQFLSQPFSPSLSLSLSLSPHTHSHTHTHTYIYIYIYLLIKYLPVFSVPEKNTKKTLPGTTDKSISNHRRGKKEKKIGSKRKKRPTSSDPLKKIKGYAVSGQKKTKNPPRMLQCYYY